MAETTTTTVVDASSATEEATESPNAESSSSDQEKLIEQAIEAEAAAEAVGPEKDNLSKQLEEAENDAASLNTKEAAPAPAPTPAKVMAEQPKTGKKDDAPETVEQARIMAANMQAEMDAKTAMIEKETEERNKKAAALSS